MRLAGYEVRLLTGNVKHGLAVAAAVGLWSFLAYAVGYTLARFTPYSIADPWPRPLGLAMAGTAVLLAAAMAVLGIVIVGGYFVEIEEVRDD